MKINFLTLFNKIHNKSLRAGNSNLDAIIILAILIIIVVIIPKGKIGVNLNPTTTVTKKEVGTQNNKQNEVVSSSQDTSSIYLRTGNAARAYQSYEEYITIENKGKSPVNITNWYLKNGKDKRAYSLGGSNVQYFPSDTAVIGQATLYISPVGKNKLQNIVLQSREKAIITTGKQGSQLPYKIVSFKESICSGYLENMDEYSFIPQLTRNCPDPEDEIGVGSLDTECRKFIETLPSCQTPEFDTRDSDGNICSNCVNGKPLSGVCVAFIKNHFNYGSCIANHLNDENFSAKTWRIFLGRGWEMWAKDYETIELFDQFGRLIKSLTY